MSFGPIIEVKFCKCERPFETDTATLGVNRDECAICALSERVKTQKDVVAIINFVVSETKLTGVTVPEMVKKLLSTKMSEVEIEYALEQLKTNNFHIFFENKNLLAEEMIQDLVRYLNHDPNIYPFIDGLFKNIEK